MIEFNPGNALSYWSRFLCIMSIFFGTFIVRLLIIVVYQELSPLFMFAMIYLFILYSSLFLFTIFTAASVNIAVYKSYKILNTLAANVGHLNSHLGESEKAKCLLKVTLL